MPDPDPSIDIAVIVDKPCWEKTQAYWEALIQPVVRETLRQAQWNQGAEINVVLSDDAAVQELNKHYRGQEKPTNVLSFPSLEPEEVARLACEEKAHTSPVILGDVVLAFETIQKESLDQKKPFDDHLLHLIAHGTLHLLGFDHEQDKDALAMESLEIRILSSLMVPNPYQG